MHPYSIDTDERKYILLLLAVASVLLTWGFNNALSYYQISLWWWIESPSVLFFYGFLFIIFDRWGWKIFRKLGLIKTPNINGVWSGHLKTSFDDVGLSAITCNPNFSHSCFTFFCSSRMSAT